MVIIIRQQPVFSIDGFLPGTFILPEPERPSDLPGCAQWFSGEDAGYFSTAISIPVFSISYAKGFEE